MKYIVCGRTIRGGWKIVCVHSDCIGVLQLRGFRLEEM